MHTEFERKVAAPAVAGWWTVLFGAGLIIVSWLAYLAIISSRPDWIISLWGPDLSWDYVEYVWFAAIAAFKAIVWLMALAAAWLTIWARQLRRSGT